MQMKKRLEELNKNLRKTSFNIDNSMIELIKLVPETNAIAMNQYIEQLRKLQRYKNEYNSIKVQIKTLTVYQTRH